MNLIMLHGLPRSGKTTWAKQQDYPIVCTDAIRLVKTGQRWWGPIEHEVWATALTMIRALFLAGHEIVILDSTSCTQKQRNYFKPQVDLFWTRYVKLIDTPIEVCIQRAINTNMCDLIEVIKRQYDNWEPIIPNECLIPWKEI